MVCVTEEEVIESLTEEESAIFDSFNEEDKYEFLAEVLEQDIEEFDYSVYSASVVAAVEGQFSKSVVVSGIPVVAEDKLPRLMNVLKSIFDKFGASEIFMPVDAEEGKTQGAAIVTYSKPSESLKAIKELDGFELDKNHTFRIFPFEEVSSGLLSDSSSSAVTGNSVVGCYSDRVDLYDFVEDQAFREQLLVRYNTETEIFWLDPLGSDKLVLEYGGEREKSGNKIWCEGNALWSSTGGYLATIHPTKGLALWGGEKFMRKARLEDSLIVDVKFAGSDKFVLAAGEDRIKKLRKVKEENDKEEKEMEVIQLIKTYKVFDVRTSMLCRSLPDEEEEDSVNMMDERNDYFSSFSWSPCGDFLARIVKKNIFIFEAPSFKMQIDSTTGKPSALKYIKSTKIAFSPIEQWLACWCPEAENVPARLAIIDFPSRREIASKPVFSTIGTFPVSIHWHPTDPHILAFKSQRLVKKKVQITASTSSTYSRSGPRGATHSVGPTVMVQKKTVICLDVLCFSKKKNSSLSASLSVELEHDTVLDFAWEPTSRRFAALVENMIIPGSDNKVERNPQLIFWTISEDESRCEEIGRISTSHGIFSAISFSPQGQYFVLWDRKGSGNLLFGTVSSFSQTRNFSIEFLRVENHYMMNNLEWDHSGRFVLSCVSQTMGDRSSGGIRLQQEASFNVFNFQGRLLYKWKKEKLWGVQWRPHPQSFLSKTEKEKVFSESKAREKEMEEEENKSKLFAKNKKLEISRKKRESFFAALEKVDKYFENKERD